jgi:hypothetical protein
VALVLITTGLSSLMGSFVVAIPPSGRTELLQQSKLPQQYWVAFHASKDNFHRRFSPLLLGVEGIECVHQTAVSAAKIFSFEYVLKLPSESCPRKWSKHHMRPSISMVTLSASGVLPQEPLCRERDDKHDPSVVAVAPLSIGPLYRQMELVDDVYPFSRCLRLL